MRATTPQQTEELLIDAVNERDIEAAVALFEAEATLVPPRGEPARGTKQIRELVTRLIGMKPKATTEIARVVESGDLALVQSHWTLGGRAPDGSTYEAGGTSAIVVRRNWDGGWKFVLLNRPGAGDRL